MKSHIKTFEGLFSGKPKDDLLESKPEHIIDIINKFGELNLNYPFISLIRYLNEIYANKKVKFLAKNGQTDTLYVHDVKIIMEMIDNEPDYKIKFMCYGKNIILNDEYDVQISYFYKKTPENLKSIDPYNEEEWN